MTEAPELLPCPFCGFDEAKIVTVRDGRRVVCHNCHSAGAAYHHGTLGWKETPRLAAEKWNGRADLGARIAEAVARERTEVARLRAFIEEFAEAKFDPLPVQFRDPQDEPDPVTDAMTVWAWQQDACAVLGGGE